MNVLHISLWKNMRFCFDQRFLSSTGGSCPQKTQAKFLTCGKEIALAILPCFPPVGVGLAPQVFSRFKGQSSGLHGSVDRVLAGSFCLPFYPFHDLPVVFASKILLTKHRPDINI